MTRYLASGVGCKRGAKGHLGNRAKSQRQARRRRITLLYPTMCQKTKVVSCEATKSSHRQPIENKTPGWADGTQGEVPGGIKMQASPTMLLKKHVEKMSPRGYPTMLMKTSSLFRLSHDVHENKDGYRRFPQPPNSSRCPPSAGKNRSSGHGDRVMVSENA